jgi:predicted adenylyl cyclase CyaB
MPKNLEVKISIKNLKQTLIRIGKLRAKKIYSSLQIDVYYQNEKGRLKVRDSEGERSVIFYNRIEDGRERWSNFHCVKVETPKEWIKFFDLFMERLVTVKKHRTLFHYKNTRIHVDRIKELGSFIELETKVNSSRKDARKEFEFLCKYLELNMKEQILKSYSDMILNRRLKTKI